MVGQVIRRVRTGAGLTQADVSKRCGLTRSYISRIEHGKISPRVQTLRRIANALDVDLGLLFCADDALGAEYCPVSPDGKCFLDATLVTSDRHVPAPGTVTRKHLATLRKLSIALRDHELGPSISEIVDSLFGLPLDERS